MDTDTEIKDKLEQIFLQLTEDDKETPKTSGTVFYKQITNNGVYDNPNYPYFSDDPEEVLDDDWNREIVANFNNDALGIDIPVTDTHHVQSTIRQVLGGAIKLEAVDGVGIFAHMNISNEEAIDGIKAGRVPDVSIAYVKEYTSNRLDGDTTTYNNVLVHIALVDAPRYGRMRDFQQITASLTNNNPKHNIIISSSKKVNEENKMDKEHKIVNTNDKELVVTYLENGNSKEVTVKPDGILNVPADQLESVFKQMFPQDTAPTEPENTETETPEPDPETPDPENADGVMTLQEATAKIVALQAQGAQLETEKGYSELLQEGRISASKEQKESIMALAKLSPEAREASFKALKLNPVVANFSQKGVEGQTLKPSPAVTAASANTLTEADVKALTDTGLYTAKFLADTMTSDDKKDRNIIMQLKSQAVIAKQAQAKEQ